MEILFNIYFLVHPIRIYKEVQNAYFNYILISTRDNSYSLKKIRKDFKPTSQDINVGAM